MTFGPITGPFGSVNLGGTQFSTDPEPYEPFNWPRRHSVHPAIGGALTIQDFGTFLRDNTLRLGSGSSRFMEESVFLALHTKYRTRGTTYTLTDWLGNSFSVFIKNFRVWPFKKGGDNVIGATISLYYYEMDLHVLGITNLVGSPFTGS